MTRSSLTCVLGSISDTSSRKSVPPLACSNRPMRRSCAPVNAPFSCPNNSLSRSCGESAAQCTATNFALLRRLKLWIACAANSLPVPLSPDKHIGRRGCDLPDGIEHFMQRGRVTQDVFEPVTLVYLLAKRAIFLLQSSAL